MLRIERTNYALGGVVILAGLITQSRDIALGLAIGAGLTCLNFFVLRKLVVRWTAAAAEGRPSAAQWLAAPKMLVLMLIVTGVMLFLPIDPIAFTIGYSIFIPSIVIEATYSAMRPTPGAETESEDKHG
jgi:hypothetical protein|nr:ATP synthase subunit I [Kofleriaceae bacterium]